MAGRALTLEQPRGAQDERTGAHRRDVFCTRRLLSQKLQEFAPQVVAFNGKTAYENFSQRACILGLQKERLYGAQVFVLPSSNGQDVATDSAKIRYFRHLAKVLAKLKD